MSELPELRFRGKWIAIMYFDLRADPQTLVEGSYLQSDIGDVMPVFPDGTNEVPGRIRMLLDRKLADGKTRKLTLHGPSGEALTKAVSCKFPVDDIKTERFGTVDWTGPTPEGITIAGWALNWLDPTQRLDVALSIDDYVVAVASANKHRADLESFGFGDGRHAFRFELKGPINVFGRNLHVHFVDGTRLTKAPIPIPASVADVDRLIAAAPSAKAFGLSVNAGLPRIYELAADAAESAKALSGNVGKVSAADLARFTKAIEDLNSLLPRVPRRRAGDQLGLPLVSIDDVAAALPTKLKIDLRQVDIGPAAAGDAVTARQLLQTSESDIFVFSERLAAADPAQVAKLVEIVATNELAGLCASELVMPDGEAACEGLIDLPHHMRDTGRTDRLVPMAFVTPGIVAVSRSTLAAMVADADYVFDGKPWSELGQRLRKIGKLVLVHEGVSATVPAQSPRTGWQAQAGSKSTSRRSEIAVIAVQNANADTEFALFETVRRRALLFAAASIRPIVVYAPGILPALVAKWKLFGLETHESSLSASRLARIAMRVPDFCDIVGATDVDLELAAKLEVEGISCFLDRSADGALRLRPLPTPAIDAIGPVQLEHLIRLGLVPFRGWTVPAGTASATLYDQKQPTSNPLPIFAPWDLHALALQQFDKIGIRCTAKTVEAVALNLVERGILLVNECASLQKRLDLIDLTTDLVSPLAGADADASKARVQQQQAAVFERVGLGRSLERLEAMSLGLDL